MIFNVISHLPIANMQKRQNRMYMRNMDIPMCVMLFLSQDALIKKNFNFFYKCKIDKLFFENF